MGPAVHSCCDLSLKHLELELARLDLLLRREARRWRLANQQPADSFRGLLTSPEEAEALLDRPFATSWGQTISLAPAELQTYRRRQAELEQQIQTLLAVARNQEKTLQLTHLATTFGLARFEIETLLVCLAPTLDLRYERLYGYLQDHVAHKRPTINLVLNLLGPPGRQRFKLLPHFSDTAPLFKHQLLTRVTEPGPAEPPLLGHFLAVDKTVASWLWGEYRPRPHLGPYFDLVRPEPEQLEPLLPLDRREALIRGLAGRPLLAFYGPDRGGRQAAAQFVAARLGRSLLQVDLAGLVKAGLSPEQALRLALRDARLIGAIPYLGGWDACLAERRPPPHLLAELCRYPAIAIVAGQTRWQAAGIRRERPLFWQTFPLPDFRQRRALWRHFLAPAAPAEATEARPGQVDPTPLADQFYLATDQIRDAVATARDAALQHQAPLTVEDLFAAARTHSLTRLGSLARQIRPRYDWADIILPPDQLTLLREIVKTVQGRSIVLEGWGLGQKLASGRGVTILFSGPPGTGKTMAAEVIARNLGLDLYKIDLSTLVSKYIGETEKNLERIFSEAERSNAILFFDEADALFGKRSEVRDSHDRYANIEISYLLQRMEAYSGVTILATNLRANLDEAFTRRLQFAVAFPFPDQADRSRIWQTLFPPTLPRHPNVDLDLLAARFKLAGGNIRNIIVNAAYLAAGDGGRVTMAHLLHSTGRELQKMGRLIKEVDLEPDKIESG